MDEDRDLRNGDDSADEPSVEIVHDDIVKRLLDYQRQLRETAEDAAATPTRTSTMTAEAPSDELVDLTTAGAGDTDDGDPGRADAATGSSAGTASPDAIVLDTTEASADVIVLHPDTDIARSGIGTTDVVDEMTTIGGEPPASQLIGSQPSRDAEHLERFERSLEDLASRFAELRSSFQDMAIAADDRLAEIEDLLARLQLDR